MLCHAARRSGKSEEEPTHPGSGTLCSLSICICLLYQSLRGPYVRRWLDLWPLVRAQVYTISPFELDIMSALWKEFPVSMRLFWLPTLQHQALSHECAQLYHDAFPLLWPLLSCDLCLVRSARWPQTGSAPAQTCSVSAFCLLRLPSGMPRTTGRRKRSSTGSRCVRVPYTERMLRS